MKHNKHISYTDISLLRSYKLLEDHSFDPFLCYTKMLWFKFVSFLKHIDQFTIILPKLKKNNFSEKLEKVVICHVRYVKHVCKTRLNLQ